MGRRFLVRMLRGWQPVRCAAQEDIVAGEILVRLTMKGQEA
jgi:hypothetical protein